MGSLHKSDEGGVVRQLPIRKNKQYVQKIKDKKLVTTHEGTRKPKKQESG
jgi:hypothetical protein